MRGKLFGGRKDNELKENEVRIALPEERYTLLQYNSDDLPCIASVNSSLVEFEHKEIFKWHLSVIIDFEDLIDKGMPSETERKIVDPFCDKLDEEIRAGGNALFLVRETWNKTRRLVWMVYDPEIAHPHLQYVIDFQKHPRQFDYHMTEDTEWQQAKWYLNAVKT
jgi:hypothetical protein